jgi:hypothetical protein
MLFPGCRKGGRECVYPEPKIATKASKSNSNVRGSLNYDSPDSSTEYCEDDDESDRLGTIADCGENQGNSQKGENLPKSGLCQTNTGSPLHYQKSFSSRGSETPSLIQDKGASPSSTEGSIVFQPHSGVAGSKEKAQILFIPSEPDVLQRNWAHLPTDVQFYLSYFYRNLTADHYSWKHDSGDFLRTFYLDAALRNNALLYGIIGFSAFQHTLGNPAGKIEDFLQYYNKAVSLLLKSLTRGERLSTCILLAILQLATIEVSLTVSINRYGTDLC